MKLENAKVSIIINILKKLLVNYGPRLIVNTAIITSSLNGTEKKAEFNSKSRIPRKRVLIIFFFEVSQEFR